MRTVMLKAIVNSMPSPLSNRLVACLYLFGEACSRCDKIIAAWHSPLTLHYGGDDESIDIPTSLEQYVPSLERFLPQLQDEYGRLRVWTGNIGAHQSGRSSLEYRLRDASHIRAQVASLLDSLKWSLSEVLAIVSGERPPEDEDIEECSDSDDSDDGSIPHEEELPQPAELFQLLEDITVVIKCLYKLSMVIRQPAQHDRLKTNVDLSHFTLFDIRHVEQKFPHAERWLTQRLGKAITKRREYLKGRERHHEKFALGDEPTATALVEDTSNTEAARRTLLSETTATTFIYGAAAVGDADIGPALSETSYASTVGDDTKLHLPPLPEEAESNPEGFECPYCYYLISVRGPLSWARHVFDDLQPYVCTFRDCSTPNQVYSRRRTWFNHEKTAHRAAQLPQGDSRAALLQSSGPVDTLSAVDCPLCREQVLSLHHLERHLARHLEQLALFAMPKYIREDNNQRGSQEGNDDNPSSEDLERGSRDGMGEYHSVLPKRETADVDRYSPLSNLIEEYTDTASQSRGAPIDFAEKTPEPDTQPSMPTPTETHADVQTEWNLLSNKLSNVTLHENEEHPNAHDLDKRIESIRQRVDSLLNRQAERQERYPPRPRRRRTPKPLLPPEPPST
ncbi:uncharacterized protein BDCG_06616 [Blastomyces dermatitidis ER-3]|uniref:C2H2-type domain-containing protein n=1 Tax=Ajellomyces dermatitidis (strain ER-3 / ATCC MYA-2586) TaxID=559297 RepID=A0ABM9YIM0_AJEDR|nr:uncharacterized protein BDCG_06616 [Blastomyces dermatitidis ER-3]EEQ91496.2 hypothetical protein BDCG_06616 [Blastomyces dermatitidis ER-3]